MRSFETADLPVHLMNCGNGFPISIVGKVGAKGEQKGQGSNQSTEWIWMIGNLLLDVIQVESLVQENINQARQDGRNNGFKDGGPCGEETSTSTVVENIMLADRR